MLSGDKLAQYPAVIVELGMGDGRQLESMAREDGRALYIGIEIDREQCEHVHSDNSAQNVRVLNGSFELLVPTFPDRSIDRFISILPDPAYIDQSKYDNWNHFYRQLYKKLKHGGTFQLVTELTDELLEPVSDENYQEWVKWLKDAFAALGFSFAGSLQGAPSEYSSRCLDQFKGDTERIRIVTMNFVKP